MEYLNGGSLDWHLENLEVFTNEQTIFYSAQILCGLFYLHGKKIIHR
jgi:serine/threonine protein kinase